MAIYLVFIMTCATVGFLIGIALGAMCERKEK